MGAVGIVSSIYIFPHYSELKAVQLRVLWIQPASHILFDYLERVHKIGNEYQEIVRRSGGLSELPQPFQVTGPPIIGDEDYNLIPLHALAIPTEELFLHSIHIISSNNAWMR